MRLNPNQASQKKKSSPSYVTVVIPTLLLLSLPLLLPIHSLYLPLCKLTLQLNNKLLPSPLPVLTPFSPCVITLHTFHYLGDPAKRDVWGQSDHYHHLSSATY